VLWQNANADLPGCHTYRKGENDRSLITSDKQNPTAQPGTDCQIEFRLIQIKMLVDSNHGIYREQGGPSCGSSHVRNAPLATVGPKNAAYRDGHGYIAARVAVIAMLAIKNPNEVNRKTVTEAIQNMKPYETDILCAPWYWGGPQATEHQPNHVTRTVQIHDGKWQNVEGC
jgi:hypothetical protein